MITAVVAVSRVRGNFWLKSAENSNICNPCAGAVDVQVTSGTKEAVPESWGEVQFTC